MRERFQVGVENEKSFFCAVLSERGEVLSTTECVEKKTRRFGLLRRLLLWMKTTTKCDGENYVRRNAENVRGLTR